MRSDHLRKFFVSFREIEVGCYLALLRVATHNKKKDLKHSSLEETTRLIL